MRFIVADLPRDSNSMRPPGLQPTRLLCPCDSPGKNTGVGCHALLQGIFPIGGSNLCLLYLLHWQRGSLPRSHLGSQRGRERLFKLYFSWPGSQLHCGAQMQVSLKPGESLKEFCQEIFLDLLGHYTELCSPSLLCLKPQDS